MSEAAITVIIPAYGVTTMLADALDSVLAQTRTDWEAIVIDDGDKRVADHVAPYLSDPRIRFLQTENGGLPTARNRALAVATTPYVSLLDGDDKYRPDYLATMIETLEASPRIGFATADATYFGSERVGEAFSTYAPQQMPATLERVMRRQFNVFVLVAMRREAIEGIGGFDQSLKSCEDLDAWIRLLEAGWELAYIPRPLAHYRRHAQQMSRNTPVMLGTQIEVMTKAEARLKGRAECIVAGEMRVRLGQEKAFEEALLRIANGEVRGGIDDLRRQGVGQRSTGWRVALAATYAVPSLAPLLLRLRFRL